MGIGKRIRSLNSKNYFWLLIFAFPIYLLVNNLLISFLGILFGKFPKLMLFGFTCTTETNTLNLIFFSILLLFKFLLIYVGWRTPKLSRFIGVLIFILLSFDVLLVVAYEVDTITETYFRFVFFASTPLYVSSYLYGFPFETIPIIFSLISLFYFSKAFKENKRRFIIASFFILLNTILATIIFKLLIF